MSGMRIIVRTDFGPSVGGGHLSRSGVLAHQLNSMAGVDCQLGLHEPLPSISNGPDGLKADLIPGEIPAFGSYEANYWVSRRPSLMIVDGYSFSEAFFRQLEASGVPYGVFDDNGETRAIHPLFIINQNVLQPLDSYRRFSAKTQFFLGPQYALIRGSLRAAASRHAPKEPYLLISLGAADIQGLSKTVIDGIAGISRDVRIAIGPMVHERDRLIKEIQLAGKARVIASGDYEKQLSQARLAVVAAGSTVWEAGFLGTPCVLLVVADNQLQIAHSAIQLGIASESVDFRKDPASHIDELSRAIERALAKPPLTLSRPYLDIGSQSLGVEIALSAKQLGL